MIESEAKKTICPKLSRPVNVDEGGTSELCVEMYWVHCQGSGCAMWESEYEPIDKEIDKDADVPDGWHITFRSNIGGTRIRQYRPTDSGDCGLKSKEQGCFYPG